MKRKILAGTLAALMLTAAVPSAVFASEGEEKVTLSFCWWGNQTRNDVTKKAVDLYMEKNPNVEIK